MTKAKKDQFVIACLERPSDADRVLPCARYCAEQLGKGLILLNVSRDGDNSWLKDYGHPYMGLRGDWKTAVDGLPTALGGVLAVVAYDRKAPRASLAHPSTLLRTFADCKIAYLAVGAGRQRWQFRSVALTIDHRRESKEKLVWASYFPRFFGSRLTAALPDYRDEDLLRRQQNNMRFLAKLYASLGVDYHEAKIPYSAFTPADIEALASVAPDLLVALTTDRRDRDVGDWLLGTSERRLLQSAADTPILFLNPRDDIYVLCD